MLLPSKSLEADSVPSASSAVGRMSSEITGVSMLRPPGNRSGQLTMNGVRIPPSLRPPLNPLSGVFSEAIDCAPPLSVRKNKTVLSNSPSCFSFFTTAPTPSSRCRSMAMRVARSALMSGNSARTRSMLACGACAGE